MASTIKRAEKLLTQVGYQPGQVDGQESPELTDAVKQFQDAWGLEATGTLDARTMAKLEFSAMRKRTAGADDKGFIGIGRKGDDIKHVEHQLRRLGYDVGKVDGVYSRQTAEAMKAFRADQAELQDDLPFATTRVREALNAEVAAVKHAPQRRRVAPTDIRRANDARTTEAAKAGIDATTSGKAVSNLQRYLRGAGFDPKRTDGTFDERTAGMVRQFQKQAGLPITGTVDAATWKSLQKTRMYTTSAAAPAQSQGERSKAVLKSEKLLASLGLNPGKVDGLFGKKTAEAVRRFEQKNGLKVDGEISTKDLATLEKAANWKTVGPPPNDYSRVNFRGVTTNVRTKVMIERAEQYLRQMGIKTPFSFSQGSYHAGYGPSGGTHDGGGALDIRVSGSWATQQKMVKALRMAGFAAWARTSADGFSPHIHAIAIGDRDSTANWQVDAYFKGYNGLSNYGPDRNASVGRPYPDWAKKYR